MINFLCKIFKLVRKKDVIHELLLMQHNSETSRGALKQRYDNKEIAEWTYYKFFWQVRGRVQLIEDLIDMLR